MKKKLFLITIMIAILTCLFIFSVNAESVKVESSSIDMVISFYDANYNEIKKTVKVDEIFNVSFKNDNEGYYFKLTGVKAWNIEIDGTTYNIKTQLAGLYFPEGITHMPDVNDGYWGFTAATVDNVRKVHLPESLQCLGGNFLRGIGYVKLVNEDGTPDNYMPNSLTSVLDHLFCNWTLVNDVIYFPEGFHNIGTSKSTTWNFEGFKAASGTITIVFLGEMTFIDVDTYENYFNPVFIFAKNSVSDLWGYALPMVEGSTNVASTASYVNNTTSSQTLRLYWPSKNGTNSSLSSSKQTATIPSSAPRLVFCEGEEIEYVMTVRFQTGTSYPALYDENGTQLNAQGISGYGSSTWMRFYTTPVKYDMDAHNTANKHYNSIVYQGVSCGYDEVTTTTCVICDLQSIVVGEKATGNHQCDDDFNCETSLVCSICEKTLTEATTHTNVTTVKYENGFLSLGEKAISCTNEGCNHSVKTELLPIFMFNGYSTNEEETAICVGYSINKDELSEYNKYNAPLKYGVVASTKTENILKVENGELVNDENTVSVQIGDEYASFDFVLSGFNTTQKDLNLVMCAYTFDGENISYMSNATSITPPTITLQAIVNAETEE